MTTPDALLDGAPASPWLAGDPHLVAEARRWAQVLGPARRSVEHEAWRVVSRSWLPPIQRGAQHFAAMQATQLRWSWQQLSSLDRLVQPVVDPVAWLSERGAELLGAQMTALGPSGEDLAWLLSQGRGVLPKPVVEAFRDRAVGSRPMAAARVEQAVESRYGGWMPFVHPLPLTTSPVSQLHDARLADGTAVLVKVLRPRIQSQLLDDARLTAMTMRALERAVPPLRAARPVVLAQLLARHALEATDLRHDALNSVELGLALERTQMDPAIVSRPVTDGFCSAACVYHLPGATALSDSLDRVDIDEAVRTVMGVTFETALDHGVFHADLRPDSVFVTPEGRLVLTGCGVLGRLDGPSRRGLALLLIGVLSADVDPQVAGLTELGMVSEATDLTVLRQDLTRVLAVNPLALLSGSGLPRPRDAVGVLLRHGLMPPVEVLLLVRSLLAGMALLRQIAPDRSVQQLLLPMLPRMLGLGPRLQAVLAGSEPPEGSGDAA